MKHVMLMLVLLLCGGVLHAQEDYGVHVTVQDNAALRAGPGRDWDRLAVLPYATTYRATGRTVNGNWIQVAYEGPLQEGARTAFTHDGITYGWVASWLLVWTGDILRLPIDGVAGSGITTARAVGPVIIIGPDTPIYRDEIDPSRQITGLLDHHVMVEATGRMGGVASGHDFWVQFKYQNTYYWTTTWALGNRHGYESLPDATYLYAYGRLFQRLRTSHQQLIRTHDAISRRWNQLSIGRAATCNDIPEDVLLDLPDGDRDLRQHGVFGALFDALHAASTATNSALARFRAICVPRSERGPVSAADIAAAQADVQAAQRGINTVQMLLNPLANRDPLLGNQ